ncbi:MAG TPA: aldehyde-activating protein [Parvularcula sp.]|nr:aldehyde-activating protein [Parvularcula sp.]HBS30748.1 aldehyde-activating protein [Parvularcula sp.]HBS33866.1 aldehyde-activating protein [Parvularcula sp.]
MGATGITGHCLCGAVAFQSSASPDEADACHCSQCRRWSGHYWASVNVPLASFKVTKGEDRIGWFRSSDEVRRGFCRDCGSALIWQPDLHPGHSRIISISAGSLDAPTGVRLKKHIFAGDKGDYYEIADGLPQKVAY